MKKSNTENQRPKPVFAKKSLGQNFLVDQNYITKIISALDPKPDETIIEIGPGRGALTERLVKSGARVIAIELDRDLIPLLQADFRDAENFTLIEKDALTIDFGQLIGKKKQKLKLVANLPYYISTAILQHLIEYYEVFSEMILMLQKEVVGRITAEPGNKERGYLTVLTEAYFAAQKLFDVPPTAFRPEPKVWSSILHLKSKEKQTVSIKDEKLFREIVSFGFRYKRKTILNNLKDYSARINTKFDSLDKLFIYNEIDSQRRAETLTIDEWKNLAGSLI